MRGGALLAVGVVLLVLALGFAGAVGVYAMRLDGQVESSGAHAPADVDPAEQVGGLKRTPPDVKPEKEPMVKSPSVPQSSARAADQPPGIVVSSLTGDVPASDTTTLVTVQACGGFPFALNAAEKKMFDLHNVARRAHGLDALCLSPGLTRVARSRSADMLDRDYFSHHTPDGKTVTDELIGLGYYGYDPGDYKMVGENISRGGDATDSDTPRNRFVDLMHSEGHRENILRKEFSEVGIGARAETYQGYDDVSTVYTIVFAGR
ncbi:MAG: CAP domain-containing protein [Rubrobacteraceae bacterium]|nr:CAP domain-containing protein [Rubrobacteraceae bacterium]